MTGVYFWEKDPFSPIKYGYEIQEILCSVRSKYQHIMVLTHSYFGKILVLDEVVQLTERDEYFYHEMLTQVALHVHPCPREILIIGGGDGGALREVLKHKTTDKVLLVEIDPEVIRVSRQFFPALSSGFSDPRARVVEMDGADFIAQTREKFDLIVVDSTDPVGVAASLFTDQFFQAAFSVLKDDGIFVAQTESLHFHQDFIHDVQQRLARVFPIIDLYTVPLATYAGNWWTFSIASKKHNPREMSRKCQVSTRYYAEDIHSQAFLPHSLCRRIKERIKPV